MAAFNPSANGQQSGLSGEQPASGNSVTLPIVSVTRAKCGTVQLPVISGAPTKDVIVICFPVEIGAVSDTGSPVSVVMLGLTEMEREAVPVCAAVD